MIKVRGGSRALGSTPGTRRGWPTALAWVQGLLGAAGALLLWQFLFSLRLVRPEYFPSPFTVLTAAALLVVQPHFLLQVLATLAAMAGGLALAILVAVPLGVLLGRSETAYRMANTLVEAMRPIPALALTPLAILVFGLSEWATVALVVWTSSWPILVNSVYGVHNVDPVLLETARSFGLSRAATLARVVLPSAAPFIATGIRIAIGIALAVAVATEMVAGTGGGVGGWITLASSGGSLVPVYAAAVLVGLLGYLVNSGVERLERRLFGWHTSLRREAV